MEKIIPTAFHQTTAFQRLRTKALQIKNTHLRELFARDPKRAEHFSICTTYLYYDYSRQLIDSEVFNLLLDLVKETHLSEKINAMTSGQKINVTENRAVLHTALRNYSEAASPLYLDGKDIRPEVREVLRKIKKFSNEVLSGKRTGFTGKKIKDIVAIGIGGSYLGPAFLAEACRTYAQKDMKLRFVANVDVTDFMQNTSDLNPEETLFVIVSKTFTTAETMKNAKTAKKWLTEKLGNHPEVIKKHFVAVSTAEKLVKEFGIDSENMFGFWDWVGGRYSATSAVGALPLSLFLGYDNFEQILSGAFWMDGQLFTPFERNISVISALIDIWNINFLGFKTRALLPYAQALAKLPAHTQQVEMESNGKSVDLEGRPVEFDTGEVVFGEPGTNGQHSFYQLLHQGTQIIPCDFIGFIEPFYSSDQPQADEVSHHQELMTNFFAQPDALAFGQDDPLPHKNFPGNRPSSTLLLQKLDPFSAGILLAWTEHRAAVKGFIWGINSFDQFGVELGKKLGLDFRRRIQEYNQSGKLDLTGLNPSTAVLLKAFLKGKLPI